MDANKKSVFSSRIGVKAARRVIWASFCASLCVLLGSQPAAGISLPEFHSPFAPPKHQTHTNFVRLDLPAPFRFEPLLGVEVGLLPIIRSHSESYDLVFTDGVSGPVETIATSDVLDPEAQLGGRLTVSLLNLSRHVPGLDTDFTYLGYDNRIASAVVSANGYATTDIYPVFFNGYPVTPTPSYTMSVDSELQSFEWLVGYRPIQRLRFTTGLRWLRLKEAFDVLETGALVSGLTTGFYSHAENEAFGWQIGAEATLWTNGVFRVFGKAKYATLKNDVWGDAIAENIQFSYDGDKTSSLVDVELGISAPLTYWAAITVAYQGLFWSDAVGAFEQSRPQSFFDPGSQTPNYHDIDWHAMNIALTMLW